MSVYDRVILQLHHPQVAKFVLRSPGESRTTSLGSKSSSEDSVHVSFVPRRRRVSSAHLAQGSSTVVHFNVVLRGLNVRASLLPSLKSCYMMDQVQASGTVGPKPLIKIDLERHSLSFISTVSRAWVLLLVMKHIHL